MLFIPERSPVSSRHFLYPKVWDIYPKAWDVHPKAWDVHTKAWDVKSLPKKKQIRREGQTVLTRKIESPIETKRKARYNKKPILNVRLIDLYNNKKKQT